VSRRSLAIVVLVQLAALVAVCLLIGDNGWDDGAITLAFARTFARHGRVALTPHSEVVEGFSSVFWFLLNAGAALARPSYQVAILVSQVLAALCISASTALLARSCALLRLDPLGAIDGIQISSGRSIPWPVGWSEICEPSYWRPNVYSGQP